MNGTILCVFLAFAGLFVPLSGKALDKVAISNADTIEYTIYETFEELEAQLLNPQEGETLLVNFWATWCGPCVKELPLFEAIKKTNQDKKLKIILVSLDFTDQLQKRFVPFIKKHDLKSELAVLADMDANKWIDMIDPSWTGTIPATIALRGDGKVFTDQEFETQEEIQEFLNQLN